MYTNNNLKVTSGRWWIDYESFLGSHQISGDGDLTIATMSEQNNQNHNAEAIIASVNFFKSIDPVELENQKQELIRQLPSDGHNEAYRVLELVESFQYILQESFGYEINQSKNLQ